MKKNLLLIISIVVIAFSCTSKSTKVPSGQFDLHQSDSLPIGKWIIESELRYFEKNGKIIEEGKLETVPSDEAYVYHFKSHDLLTVSNLKNDFSWDFKIENKDSVYIFRNLNGDAEDDELACFLIPDNKMVLHRKINDADPDDENGFIVANFVMTLSKVQ